MLRLVDVSDADVVGIYKVNGVANKMPARMRRLFPEARDSFLRIMRETPGVIISDMFRSAESSLQAVADGRGALAPSFSGHNYGLAIDIDVSSTMKRVGIKKKPDLDAFMQKFGWYCHRRDGKREFEEWHYDFDFGLTKHLKPTHKYTQQARELMIRELYADQWKLPDLRIQEQLKSLGLYGGALDGKLGPLSKQAIAAFQRTWKLKVTSTANERTCRLLWFVASSKALPPVAI